MVDGNVCPRGRRIVLTGGPGGGKTTAGDMLRRELGDRVAFVPEAATMLFAGGFPRSEDPAAARSAQMAIYHVQRNLENVQMVSHPGRILLCDRGTVDGAAYWPGEPADFFEAAGSNLETELLRYDGVIFFESAACGGHSIESGNPMRTEGLTEAALLDGALRDVWGHHPCMKVIPNTDSFFTKIRLGLDAFTSMVDRLENGAR